MTAPHPAPDGFPLSKPCDLVGDAGPLAAWLAQVDAVPAALAGQHAIRRWEYGMALCAIDRWRLAILQQGAREAGPTEYVTAAARDQAYGPLQICDVGGAGSNFWQVLKPLVPADTPILVVDQHGPDRVWRDGEPVQYWKESIETFAAHAGHDQFDILTGISVIEHVVDVRPFLRACRMLLKPGGLLVLTTDYWDADGPDVAHFHWMRERIYNRESIRALLISLRELGYKSFGAARWHYPGPQLYDYTVASLTVVKA